MPAVEDRGHIDVDNVAGLERFVARNAVAHDMVDRRAAAFGEAAIAERRGNSAGVERHTLDNFVEFTGGDAGHDVGHERVEDRGGEAAGGAHPGEPLRPVELDDARARFGAVVGSDADIFGHDA